MQTVCNDFVESNPFSELYNLSLSLYTAFLCAKLCGGGQITVWSLLHTSHEH